MKRLVVLFVLGYAAYWFYENKWSYSDSSLEIQAKAMNRSLPRRLSTELTLISVETKPGKILTYNV